MQLPALAIQQPNVPGIYQAIEGIETARANRRLIGLKEAAARREGKITEARLALFGNGQGPGTAGPGATTTPSTTDSLGIDLQSPEFKTYMALDPEGGKQIIDSVARMDETQRKRATETNERAGNILASIITAPPIQRPALYQQAREMAPELGIDPKNLPEQWDDNWGRLMLARAGMTDDLLKMQDRPLQEYADPTSPTGTRLGTRPEALGKPGKPPSSMKLRVGKDGSVEFSQGPGGDMGTKAQNTLEEKVINAQEGLSRLADISAKFKPDYQTIDTRFGAAWTALKEKWGSVKLPVIGGVPFLSDEIKPEDQELLREFTQYKRSGMDNLSRYIKEITGAQASIQEMDRITRGMPNPGEGVFDGDSPTEFKAKMDDTIMSLKLAQARASYARSNGLPADPERLAERISLPEMKEIMKKRAKQISDGLPAGLTEEEKKRRTAQQLSDEFGLPLGGQ